jgi:hypothetical protein
MMGKTDVGSTGSNADAQVSADASSIGDGETPEAAARTGRFSMKGPDGIMQTIVTLDVGVKTSDLLAEVAGKNEKAVFQKKDAAGNVVYSLSFLGAMIEGDTDVTLDADITDNLPEHVSVKSGEAMLLRFVDHKPLPADAEVYVAAGGRFGADPVDVYQVDPLDGSVALIAQNGLVQDGYLSFDLGSTNDVILANGTLDAPGLGSDGPSALPIAIAAVLAIAVAATVVFFVSRKRGADRHD